MERASRFVLAVHIFACIDPFEDVMMDTKRLLAGDEG